MVAKQYRNIYLYLALICFVGILAIFVADGYLGIYDTLSLRIQEREHRIGADYWRDDWVNDHGYSMGVAWGEQVHFEYKIDNNRFSSYLTNVDVSVWKSGEEILDLYDEDISIDAFDEIIVNWTLELEQLEDANLGIGEYTIRIENGDIVRKVVIGFHSNDNDGYPKIMPPLSR